MLKVIIPTQADFRKYENPLRLLYEKLQPFICDTNSFEFVRDKTLFYAFTVDDMLLGGIYYYLKDNKLFLNSFARRGFLKEKLECLKLSTTWFNCDIYALAQNRVSTICLFRLGFKRVKDNLFILKK